MTVRTFFGPDRERRATALVRLLSEGYGLIVWSLDDSEGEVAEVRVFGHLEDDLD